MRRAPSNRARPNPRRRVGRSPAPGMSVLSAVRPKKRPAPSRLSRVVDVVDVVEVGIEVIVMEGHWDIMPSEPVSSLRLSRTRRQIVAQAQAAPGAMSSQSRARSMSTSGVSRRSSTMPLSSGSSGSRVSICDWSRLVGMK